MIYGYYFYSPDKYRQEQTLYYIGFDLEDNKYVTYLTDQAKNTIGRFTRIEDHFIIHSEQLMDTKDTLYITIDITDGKQSVHHSIRLEKKDLTIIDCEFDEEINEQADHYVSDIEVPDGMFEKATKGNWPFKPYIPDEVVKPVLRDIKILKNATK